MNSFLPRVKVMQVMKLVCHGVGVQDLPSSDKWAFIS